MIVLGAFPTATLKKSLKWNNDSFRNFSNEYVGKVPKDGKMKVLDTFRMGTLKKYLKMKKWKKEILGIFPMGTLEKYLKMEKWKF